MSQLQTIPQQEFIAQGGFGRISRIQHPRQSSKTALKKQFKIPGYYDLRRQRMNKISSSLKSFDPEERYFTGLILQDTPHSLIMQQGGQSLPDVFKQPLQQKRTKLRAIFEAFPNLLNGLLLLNERRLVHGDIKADNILWDNESKSLRFIDYDFMGTETEVRRASRQGMNFPFKPKNRYYSIWPLERFNLGTKEEMLNFIENTISKTFPTQYCRMLKNFYESTPMENIQEIPSKIDVFSLGFVAYLLFLKGNNTRFLNTDPHTIDLIREELIRLIFYKMMNPNPQKRTIPLKEWKTLLTNIEQLGSW